MTLELKKLFESLQPVFDFDPMPRAAFRLSFDQSGQDAFLTIENGLLKTRTTGGADSLSYVLNEWLFDRLAEDINTKTGYTAAVLDTKFNHMLAGALLDGIEDHDLGTSKDLAIATNPIWVLLKPLALAIAKRSLNVDDALAQLNVLTSRTFFVEFWGRFLGVVRKEGESDVRYAQGIVDRVLLLRANNKAMEKIVYDDLGIEVAIRDLLPEVLNLNGSPVFSKLPGQVYNVGNFLVDGEFGGQPLIDLIDRHRAGGTKAFFRQLLDHRVLDRADGITVDFFDLSLFDLHLVDREFEVLVDVGGDVAEVETGLPIWTVGETPMPGSVIGG